VSELSQTERSVLPREAASLASRSRQVARMTIAAPLVIMASESKEEPP
jgi:hypothetical protein